jgi:hypothetical protein
MGDSISETSEQSKCRLHVVEKSVRDRLRGRSLYVEEASVSFILNNIDYFLSQSIGNKSIKQVHLDPYPFTSHDDDAWDKFGQAVENLQSLKGLRISTRDRTYPDHHDEDEVRPHPGWERVARIFSRMRKKIEVELDDSILWALDEVQALGQAIRGHPTITSFNAEVNFSCKSSDTLCSALTTLPALGSVRITCAGSRAWQEDDSTMAHHTSLTELLRGHALRSVCFNSVVFTPALCQAAANALVEGTTVTKLEFRSCCFVTLECAAMMASAFSRNTSVSNIEVVSPPDQTFYSALATALPLNSTMRELLVSNTRFDDILDFSPVLLALGNNTGLKTLKVSLRNKSMDESLCTAMTDGLGKNVTLESLEFNSIHLTGKNSDLWCKAFSFLRTNNALKSLIISMQHGVTESCLSSFRIDVVAMLQENRSLESLSITINAVVNAEECIAHVTLLQQNTTLKRLIINPNRGLTLTTDEDKQMAALLRKNYALESLPNISSRDVVAILRLNAAGRRYLIEDASSISRGVEVLSRVNDDINCVFLHLLENPTLCERTAVEIVNFGESNSSTSTNPTASSAGGKREDASTHENKESRRRLA